MCELEKKPDYNKASAKKLILLCVILYTITTAGKKIFNANTNELMRYFGQDKTAIGIITTCFFIACAAGQIVHGILCRRYNVRYVIFVVLIVTGTLYGAVPMIPRNLFGIIKYLWIVNGFVEAALWVCLLYFINTCIADRHLSFTFSLLTIPTPVGNCLALGISSLFSLLRNFKWSFYLIFILYMVIAAVWIIFAGRLQKDCKREKAFLDGELPQEKKAPGEGGTRRKLPVVFIVTFAGICVLCIAEQVCYEGLINWLPTILVDEYKLENWLSVLLTIFLPVVAYFGNMLGKAVQAKTKNYLLSMGLFFGCAAVCCGITIAFFGFNVWAVTLACATLCTCVVAGANMIETVIFPLENSRYVNSGLMGGIICASCYAGCAVSGYGLGGIADNGSWLAAFRLLFFLMLGAMVLAIGLCIVNKKAEKRVNKDGAASDKRQGV